MSEWRPDAAEAWYGLETAIRRYEKHKRERAEMLRFWTLAILHGDTCSGTNVGALQWYWCPVPDTEGR